MPGPAVPAPAMPAAIPGPAMPAPMVPPPSALPSPVAPIPGPAAPPPPTAAAGPAFDDPFAAMRAPEGRHFDLRAVQDDMRPAISVRRRTGIAGLLILVVVAIGTAVIGFWFGGISVGRRNFNQTNAAAKVVKEELDGMQKTITEIATKVALSQERLVRSKRSPLDYDPKLLADLAMVKLDPRPDTSRMFRVNYAMLPDLAVDRLMNYYYDAVNLYVEVERHIKRTRADKASLEAFAARMAEKGEAAAAANYGVVFSSRGKLAIGTLVEIGRQVCRGGAETCSAADMEGFEIRSNTGAPWTTRRTGPKPEGDKVVPIEKTPLFEAVMSGSPDQVRMEQYKQRSNSIRQLLTRLAATKKELGEAIDKAAQRPDLFTF
jgi:hypothetical protein